MRLLKPKNPLKKLNSKAVKKVSKGTPLRLVLVVPLEDVLKVGGYCKKTHKAYAEICRYQHHAHAND